MESYQNASKTNNLVLKIINKNFTMKKAQNEIKSEEMGKQASKQILLNILQQILAPPLQVAEKPLTSILESHYYETYNLYQAKCYQQFSPNLCGYHAIFNTFCFLKMMEGGNCQYDIQSGASFWKFKLKVEAFLFEMKRKYKLPDQWPWRDKDIMEGDFERTYNKICLQRFDQFSLFNKSKNFIYIPHTWMFQYQNLILQNDSRNQLTKKFAEFQKYKGAKPMVLHLMMGITTHWVTFLAVKKNNEVQYWFIDSHNHHHLNFSWQQIVNLIEKKSKERTKYGKPEFTNFQKQSYSMCIKDIQTSLKLIIDCLEGRQTLDSFTYNQKFNLFAQPLQAAMTADYESVSIVVKEYQYNIRSFFIERVQWQLLSNNNHQIMKQIIKFSGQVKNHGQEGRFLYSLTQMQIGNF